MQHRASSSAALEALDGLPRCAGGPAFLELALLWAASLSRLLNLCLDALPDTQLRRAVVRTKCTGPGTSPNQADLGPARFWRVRYGWQALPGTVAAAGDGWCSGGQPAPVALLFARARGGSRRRGGSCRHARRPSLPAPSPHREPSNRLRTFATVSRRDMHRFGRLHLVAGARLLAFLRGGPLPARRCGASAGPGPYLGGNPAHRTKKRVVPACRRSRRPRMKSRVLRDHTSRGRAPPAAAARSPEPHQDPSARRRAAAASAARPAAQRVGSAALLSSSSS